MKGKRLPITLSDRLEEEIAALVGRRGREAFVREAVQQEIERRRALATAPKPQKDAAKHRSGMKG